MSPEVALLNETWEIVRNNLPAKERLVIADSILRAFSEHIDIEELPEYANEFDKVMKAAIKDFFDEGMMDDDDDDDDYGSW